MLSALDCLAGRPRKPRPHILVDRDCGMAAAAPQRGFPLKKLPYRERSAFSEGAAEYFADAGCRQAVMFYSRLIDPDPFHRRGVEIYNIHPSLLPALPGMNAVARARRAGVRMLGATLHLVDNGVDTGPIVEQVAVGLTGNETLSRLEFLSFLQKVYLTLLWFERVLAEPGGEGDFVPLGPAVQAGSAGLRDPRLASAYRALSEQK
jgi:phosphoribosylglycinamide formyltransferase-1